MRREKYLTKYTCLVYLGHDRHLLLRWYQLDTEDKQSVIKWAKCTYEGQESVSVRHAPWASPARWWVSWNQSPRPQSVCQSILTLMWTELRNSTVRSIKWNQNSIPSQLTETLQIRQKLCLFYEMVTKYRKKHQVRIYLATSKPIPPPPLLPPVPWMSSLRSFASLALSWPRW